MNRPILITVTFCLLFVFSGINILNAHRTQATIYYENPNHELVRVEFSSGCKTKTRFLLKEDVHLLSEEKYIVYHAYPRKTKSMETKGKVIMPAVVYTLNSVEEKQKSPRITKRNTFKIDDNVELTFPLIIKSGQ